MKKELIKQMGLRWIVYRTQYEVKKKLGYLERRYPATSLKDVTRDINIEIIKDTVRKNLKNINLDNQISGYDLEKLLTRVDLIFQNKFRYFFNEYHDFKSWHYSPKTDKYADTNIHWSKISDLNNDFGDIKWIWDLNRFTFAYDLSRAYIYTNNEKYAEKFWELYEDFVESNPLELGPNYRCSQEMSFRANAWIFSLYTFIDSPSSTEKRIKSMINMFNHYMNHINHHINFSVEAVKNNHSISEATMLIVFGKTLSFLEDAKKHRLKGEKVLLKEINWQFKDDGSYIQHSHNYHRLALQNLSWLLVSYQSTGTKFPKVIKEKAEKSIKFFESFITKHGEVPNYGMNDGSYIFPLTEREYYDYRPFLQCLNYQLNQTKIFKHDNVDEILNLLNRSSNSKYTKNKSVEYTEFNDGGYFVLRKNGFQAIVKSKTYKERPNQADNNILDLWFNDKNIFKDAGTYSYNDSDEVLNYFNGTKSHNTVFINGENQMIKGSRFIWYKWSRAQKDNVKITGTALELQVKLLNYNQFEHMRKVEMQEEKLFITDLILNKDNKKNNYEIQFLTEEDIEINNNEIRFVDVNLIMTFESDNTFEIKNYNASKKPFRGWISNTYGELHPANQIVISISSDKNKFIFKTIIKKVRDHI